MTQLLRIARELSWTTDESFYERDPELGATFTVELFAPTGHYCQLSVDGMRALMAFGAGRTIAQVGTQLEISTEESQGFAALVEELVQRGLLVPADSPEHQTTPIAPAFLVSAHGCGGTLVRWLADSHPQIACAAPHRLGVVLRELIYRSRQLGAFAAMTASVPTAMRGFRTILDDVLGLHARRRQKDGWLWASRDHDQCLDFIDDVYERTGRFVILVRHPMDATVSSVRKNEVEGWKVERLVDALRAHEVPELAYAHYWKQVYERVRAFRDDHPDRTLVIRYEDLVQRPAEETARLCHFLGIRTPQRLHEQAFRHGHEFLWGGWESGAFTKATELKSDQVDLWRTWRASLRDRVDVVLGEEMKHWGYSAAKELGQ
jgi:hypothetical protein